MKILIEKVPSSNEANYERLLKAWTTLPSLSTGRYNHASCATEKFVFVFGGYGRKREQREIEVGVCLSSFEQLDFRNEAP